MHRADRLITLVILLIMLAAVSPAGLAMAQTEDAQDPDDTFTVPVSAGLDDMTAQQRLGLEEAQKVALENNIDLANARKDLRMAELEIIKSKANYDPYVRADGSYSSSKSPSSQQVFGQTSETTSMNFSTGVTTVTGGNMSLSFNNSRTESDSVFSTLNPSYNTDLSLNVTQPLLKNRYNDTRDMELTQKRNDLEKTRLAFESMVLEIESSVEEAYWSLVRSGMDLKLSKRSLDLNERLHHMTEAQVRAGTAAQVATLQTEANIASSRASLVRTENEYRKSQFNLKAILNLSIDDLWSLEIIPTDLPAYSPPAFNREEVIKESLANNISLRQTRYNIASAEITNEQYKNRTLPQLDLRASVGVSGLAGTDDPQDQVVQTGFVVPNPLPPDQFPQPYINETTVVPGQPSEYEGDYYDALENMFESDNLSWSAGVTFQVPIGNRAAKADYEKNMIGYEKSLSDLHDQERQTFMSLINLIYDFEAAHRSYLAAREARRLQSQNLKTEERKFSLGLNTNYEVLQAEESYTEARGSEIGALIEYTRSKGRMDRARKGYLGGTGSSAMSLNIPSSMSAGSLPSGVDAGSLEGLSGQLPAGVDINMLKSFMP